MRKNTHLSDEPQKLACDAVQELRIKHRWDAIQESNDEMEEARLSGPFVIRMVTPARNCSYVPVICSLNLQTIGHNGKKREHLYCLMNIQISSRHMDNAIPYE